MKFNEDSRVKVPTLLHLVQLGYTYLSLKGANWDPKTNIFTNIFKESISKINPELDDNELDRFYNEVLLSLENEDLGKAFYEKLVARSGKRLIDFEHFQENNQFHVVTELPCKKDDESFRPDITLLINGMPLVFIEVKKPNNLDGVQAERKRMVTRFQNKKFKNFINVTQFMLFSNNMEYDDEAAEPLQGAFYSTTSYKSPIFNFFREPEDTPAVELETLTEAQERAVLKDNNLLSILHSPEYITNKDSNSPTNRMCSSLLQKERLAFLLEYAITYVNEANGLQKHIMRYPQIFATKAIEQKLDEGIKKGIIWHTQGSGKTALAFYNVKFLTHYYQQKGIVPKFYFIVDRLDLLTQACKEFRKRDLIAHEVDSKEAFAREIKSSIAIHNDTGQAEITVVNIHKFKDDPAVVRNTDYQVNIQRIYFLDEVHRSYNPKGSFLANLRESDPNSVKIGLTGTPLLGKDYNSKQLFGNYIHKYYYNSSIKDRYTLRLIREEIETSYKLKLKEILEQFNTLEGSGKKDEVYAHHSFVEPLLEYIVSDLENFRTSPGDATVGGMVICDSSQQAKKLQEIFEVNYAASEPTLAIAAEDQPSYSLEQKEKRKVKKSALILHDVGTKEDRKDLVEDFKDGKIDLLFVYNMLLTGFDAKRLKKLYLTRVIKAHNLLQALTRVNRTYGKHRYGYVVDFADIQKEFDKTNRDYFNELQAELGDELEHYSELFKKPEEIQQEIETIKDLLFEFDTVNPAVFSRQISDIHDHAEMLRISKALNDAKSLYNLIRLSGQYELLERLDFKTLGVLSKLANDRLTMINTKNALENDLGSSNLLHIALEDILFDFTKVGEEELVLADQLKDHLQRTREALAGNFDPKDPAFISLKEELKRLFKKKNLSEVNKEEMNENIKELEVIYNKAIELERKNQLLRAKYQDDEKYARLHKRLMEEDPISDSNRKLSEVLQELKKDVDEEIGQNTKQLNNESYVAKMLQRLVIHQFKEKMPLSAADYKRVNLLLVKEYLNEYYGGIA